MQPILVVIHPPTLHNIFDLVDMQEQLGIEKLVIMVAVATTSGTVFFCGLNTLVSEFEVRNAIKDATKCVDELQQELIFYHDVIDKLQLDLTLDSVTRRLILQIANSRKWEDADKLGREILEVVRIPDKDIEVYKSALEKAQKFVNNHPYPPN